jgi:BirA family biotin operon repressor/biotin-[acetyl-CoA-carboxylase] ligase
MDSYTPLDIDRIEQARQDCIIGCRIVPYQSTASTNDIAWAYAGKKENHGLCVVAESQHKGRGRRGRVWFSEPGQSILCSVLLTKTDIGAELLTLTTAVAAAEAINQTFKLSCRIKWPNDILIQNQKVAGILVEKRIQNNTPCCVFGIGINCNQQPEAFEDCDLKLPATSLAIEIKQQIDRTALVCELLRQLETWLDRARIGRGCPTDNPVIDRWLQMSGMLGQHITVECDGRQYSGFCRGVDPAEGLILQLDNNLVRMFTAAQTSVVYNP